MNNTNKNIKRKPGLAATIALTLVASASAAGNDSPRAGQLQNVSGSAAKLVHYVVTNDDEGIPFEGEPNTATFYVAGPGGKLSQKTVVKTGGLGVGNGYFAAPRVGVVHDKAETCVYVSDAGSNDVAGIVLSTFKVAGDFQGSSGDLGSTNGIGLALNAEYLYAAFTGSNTIATFRQLPGCKLKFVGDVTAIGLSNGPVDGMAVHGQILVVAYADGSIESFNVSKGAPLSNGDEQLSTGFQENQATPAGVDISKDGRFAVFGDAVPSTGVSTDVEVSDISSGKLRATVSYSDLFNQFDGVNSNNVWFSPDGSLLYVALNNSGSVGAAFFDQASGKIKVGCSSGSLRGYGSTFEYTTGLATQEATGTGGIVYTGEWSSATNPPPSAIGIVKVQSNGRRCTLTEADDSPVSDPQSTTLRSLSAYPPRPF